MRFASQSENYTEDNILRIAPRNMTFGLSPRSVTKNTVASLAGLSITALAGRSRLPLIGSAHQPADTGLILTRIGPSLTLSEAL